MNILERALTYLASWVPRDPIDHKELGRLQRLQLRDEQDFRRDALKLGGRPEPKPVDDGSRWRVVDGRTVLVPPPLEEHDRSRGHERHVVVVQVPVGSPYVELGAPAGSWIAFAQTGCLIPSIRWFDTEAEARDSVANIPTSVPSLADEPRTPRPGLHRLPTSPQGSTQPGRRP